MPRLADLARTHGLYELLPHCFRCKDLAPADRWENAGLCLHRAHVIDRWAGGSDLAHNL